MAFIWWEVGTEMEIAKNESGNQKSGGIKRERDDDGCRRIGGLKVGNWGGHGHAQGGTHKETPCPAILVVNGAARLLAEAGVSFGMVEVKMTKSEVLELIDSEAQFPGNVCPPDGKGVVVCWGEGHGVVVK